MFSVIILLNKASPETFVHSKLKPLAGLLGQVRIEEPKRVFGELAVVLEKEALVVSELENARKSADVSTIFVQAETHCTELLNVSSDVKRDAKMIKVLDEEGQKVLELYEELESATFYKC